MTFEPCLSPGRSRRFEMRGRRRFCEGCRSIGRRNGFEEAAKGAFYMVGIANWSFWRTVSEAGEVNFWKGRCFHVIFWGSWDSLRGRHRAS